MCSGSWTGDLESLCSVVWHLFVCFFILNLWNYNICLVLYLLKCFSFSPTHSYSAPSSTSKGKVCEGKKAKSSFPHLTPVCCWGRDGAQRVLLLSSVSFLYPSGRQVFNSQKSPSALFTHLYTSETLLSVKHVFFFFVREAKTLYLGKKKSALLSCKNQRVCI